MNDLGYGFTADRVAFNRDSLKIPIKYIEIYEDPLRDQEDVDELLKIKVEDSESFLTHATGRWIHDEDGFIPQRYQFNLEQQKAYMEAKFQRCLERCGHLPEDGKRPRKWVENYNPKDEWTEALRTWAADEFDYDQRLNPYHILRRLSDGDSLDQIRSELRSEENNGYRVSQRVQPLDLFMMEVEEDQCIWLETIF
ncbi:uncharacterized protein EI97DRAFT_69829 [Westerdykella ornata]|uniref:Uncharacterized protein n=1 Tax=Westerdykella ornata TaxID=318751 RepID=A0A6A6JH53_WESOR|nr:uncharacterized protein EI97DRAFT_69829 [Westerdykella ornata]KAF2275697.1 hypothetical protein EI97DRAFT_69829 [Westerdykella ornata]